MVSGYILIVKLNLIRVKQNIMANFEIVAFVKADEKAPEVLSEKIRNLPDVKTVKLVTRDEVKEKMAEQLSNEILFTDENPFPDTISIQPVMVNGKSVREIFVQLKEYPNIDEVDFDENKVDVVESLNIYYKFTNIFSFTILLFISVGMVYLLVKRKITVSISMIYGLAGAIAGAVMVHMISTIITPYAIIMSALNLLTVVFIGFISGLVINLLIQEQ